jgi:Amt family ammonium transporter
VVSASIGVAVSSTTTVDGPSLLRDADAAMYRAKAAGRNRIEIFDQSMRDQAVERLELENDLRNAVERGELEIEYQPVVDLMTGQAVMFEALLRWDHPGRGRLQPAEFIPLAEETGLILKIGNFVLTTALAQLSRWQRQYPITPAYGVTVNVSGRQLAEKGYLEGVAVALRGSGITPNTLGLELTESVLLGRNLPPEVLDDLRALGAMILLDDFGTGYSSLAYLEQFPIDVLKVDKAFVARLDEGAHRAVVLEAILTMARALQIRVIAEGAENEERIRTLRALGCNWVQGYAICRPMPVDAVDLYLEEQGAISRALGS